MQAHQTRIEARADVKLGIISPDGRDAMIEHAEQFAAAGIPFLFDPGQGLPMFDGEALKHFISLATWVTVNDYEGKMLSDRTGLSFAKVSEQVQGLIVTLGGDGSEVWVNGEKTLVAPVVAEQVVDPTGCGDAYRAALLYGLEQGWPLARCAALGSQLGALKIAQRGPQNYVVDRAALGL
jgi:adenosine kinase